MILSSPGAVLAKFDFIFSAPTYFSVDLTPGHDYAHREEPFFLDFEPSKRLLAKAAIAGIFGRSDTGL